MPSHFVGVTSLTPTLQEDEEMAARCETVLNTTMAEMDTYHAQKLEDFQDLAKEHLDGEIALYEQVCFHMYSKKTPVLMELICTDSQSTPCRSSSLRPTTVR